MTRLWTVYQWVRESEQVWLTSKMAVKRHCGGSGFTMMSCMT